MSFYNKLFRKKSVEQALLNSDSEDQKNLSKHLTARDLTGFGIAAIIGAGIFSTIGNASADGGPAIIFLFLFTAIACGFAAFAYAEFASMVPVSGSAYTYSYVAFGELTAWIIGWALIMEYGIGNITVAISWSDYFTSFLGSMNVHLPDWMTMDYLSASNGFKEATALMASGKSFDNLDAGMQTMHNAWITAPQIGGFHLVADLPALAIIIFITWLVYRGIRESRNASNLMVVIKLCIVLLVIAVGVFYVDTNNWNPFAPNGVSGILKGVSAVFFAYIGFDAISTTAEECKDPQRDLPKSMMWSIIICTILYVLIALVLTGIVKYDQLAVGDPLAFVFDKINLKWMSGIIGISAIVAMASVLLVFQLGQPRIWMSMSRDGLLPKRFSKIHPKFFTPSFATIVTGFLVAVPALFMNIRMVTDLCSIGTLFAFVLVCAGVLKLQNDPNVKRGKFKTPYINAALIMPALLILAVVLSLSFNKTGVVSFLTNESKVRPADDIVVLLKADEIQNLKQVILNTDSIAFREKGNDVHGYLDGLDRAKLENLAMVGNIDQDKIYESGFGLFIHKIPMWFFIIICLVMTYYSYTKKLSLIPLLGFVCCLYMMTEMGISNWIGFSIWLFVGLIIYFLYGFKNSKLAIK